MSAFRSFVSARAAIGAFVLVAASTLGIAAPPATATATATATAGANTTTIDVGIDDCVIKGGGGPNHGHVKVEWRSADGTLRELATADSYDGYWGTEPTDDCFDLGAGVEPGDVITTTVKGASRVFTVPMLTVRVDRNTDRVTGVSKPNSKLSMRVDTRGPGGGTVVERTVRSAGDGTYLADFQTGQKADIRGWDRVDVYWTDARGDYVRAWNLAPAIQVTIGRGWIEAAGQAGQNATLKLRQAPGGAVIARTGGILYSGWNAFGWLDPNGQNVQLAEGNKVETNLAADASFVVPTLVTNAKKSTDVVTLSTGLGPNIGVEVEATGNGSSSTAQRVTDASGRVVVNFIGDSDVYYDIIRGTRLTITVRLTTGDEVKKIVIVE